MTESKEGIAISGAVRKIPAVTLKKLAALLENFNPFFKAGGEWVQHTGRSVYAVRIEQHQVRQFVSSRE